MKIILRKKDGEWNIPEGVACDRCGTIDDCATVTLIDELLRKSQFTACSSCLQKEAIDRLLPDIVSFLQSDHKISLLNIRNLFDYAIHINHRQRIPDIQQLLIQFAPKYGWTFTHDGLLIPTPAFFKMFPLSPPAH